MVSSVMVTGFFSGITFYIEDYLSFWNAANIYFFIHVSVCINADIHKYICMCLYMHTHTRPRGPAYVCTNSIWIQNSASIHFNFQCWLMAISQQKNDLSSNSRHQEPSALSSEHLDFHESLLLEKKNRKSPKLRDTQRSDSTVEGTDSPPKTKRLCLELEDCAETSGPELRPVSWKTLVQTSKDSRSTK